VDGLLGAYSSTIGLEPAPKNLVVENEEISSGRASHFPSMGAPLVNVRLREISPMAPSDRKNMVQRVAARFLQGALDRAAAFNMDMFARLSILEGAAGVAPGKWLRKGARGFGDALEHFGPHLAASWTTTRNEGVYDKALAAASRVLSSHSGMGAADLVQDMVVNSTSPSGTDRTKIFYTVGKKLGLHKNDLGAGDITPRDSKILGTLERWVRQAALDEIKSLRSRSTQTFAPGQTDGPDPTRTRGVGELTPEKRSALMLLALQSPGGPGREIRRIIDRLVDQSFPKSSRPIVKVFMQKISEPKYRSPEKMRQMVTKFKPDRWFGQAVNLIRKEMMAEMGVSAQHLTNVLGSKAKNVFRFMREKVGRDPAVKRILEELAQEIDLLEPGAVHLGTDHESELTEEQTPLEPHEVMVEWLRQSEVEDEDEKTGHLPVQHELHDLLHEIFEKDEYMNWDAQTGPHAVHMRGPVELRVARRFLLEAAK